MTDKTNQPNYKVVAGNNDTMDLYSTCLEFLDTAIQKYTDEESDVQYAPAEVISGLTHCMLKIMFKSMGYETTVGWLEQVKAMHDHEAETKKYTITGEPNNTIQ